jgi:hypothetical protein
VSVTGTMKEGYFLVMSPGTVHVCMMALLITVTWRYRTSWTESMQFALIDAPSRVMVCLGNLNGEIRDT